MSALDADPRRPESASTLRWRAERVKLLGVGSH
jgi:hypothetical protein